ncbi:MAG: gamma-glutamyltransferase, partial [Roseateles sp.]
MTSKLLLIALALHLSQAGAIEQPEAATTRSARAPGLSQPAQRFAVTAANPLAAQAGLEMLRAGGSAMDAAIAVQLVLGLVEPQSSGIA